MKKLHIDSQAQLVEGFTHGIFNFFTLVVLYDAEKNVLNAQPLGSWAFSRAGQGYLPCFNLTVFGYGGKGRSYSLREQVKYFTLIFPDNRFDLDLTYAVAGVPLEDKKWLLSRLPQDEGFYCSRKSSTMQCQVEDVFVKENEFAILIGRLQALYNRGIFLENLFVEEYDCVHKVKPGREWRVGYKGKPLN